MSTNQPPVEAIQGEARAREVREKVARAKASLLHLEMFAEGDDIKRVRDAIAAIALLAPSPTFADAGEVRTYREGVSGEWQEIETAPKDGTDVLLFTDTRASDSVSMRIYLHTGGEHFTAVQIGFWEDAVDAPMRKERAGWRKGKIGEPTHWMPMPTPPAAAIRKLP